MMYPIFWLLVTSYFVWVLGDEMVFNGYESLANGALIDGIKADEISGITYNFVDGAYYAVSDDLIVNKGFYGFYFDVHNETGSVSYTILDGIQMDPSNEQTLTTMDSESIIFIRNPYNESRSYYIVGQEGHNTYGTANELYLYSTNGRYIRTISAQLAAKYKINNTESNRGVEGLAIDETQTYIVYATEKSLVSDTSLCTNCIRLSINTFTGEIGLNELYELRYDLDTIDTTKYTSPDAYVGLSDLVIFQNKNDKLYGLILERAATDDALLPFDNKIYLVDLTDKYRDVKKCYSLSDDSCKEIEAIEKTLLFSFATDTGNDTLAQNVKYLNFEVLSILYDTDRSFYDDENVINLVAINDNGDFDVDTYFLYLKYDASNTLEDDLIYTTMPETTVIVPPADSTTEPPADSTTEPPTDTTDEPAASAIATNTMIAIIFVLFGFFVF